MSTCIQLFLSIIFTLAASSNSKTTGSDITITYRDDSVTKPSDTPNEPFERAKVPNYPIDDTQWSTSAPNSLFEFSTHPFDSMSSSVFDVTEVVTTSSVNTNSISGSDDSVTQQATADRLRTEPHPCLRECIAGAPPMSCFYHFEVEGYFAMSKACYNCPLNTTDCERPDCVAADGFKRSLIVVNRQMPGPSIEVCHGDHIVVEVVNHIIDQSVTIHWHGIHQEGTPYMDGVPFVTQCPIGPSSSFRYEFAANPAGTHFWHSHQGIQRANGLFGSLIVRIPRVLDPNSEAYDQDLPSHTMQILDWDHISSEEKFLAHYHGGGDNKPPTLLINGRGRNYEATSAQDNHVPLAKFCVHQGNRFRFRLINAGFLNCPIQLSVDNHNITIIGSDSSLLEPVEGESMSETIVPFDQLIVFYLHSSAESLVSYAGERFDFVINANQPVDNYWLRLRGLLDCGERDKSAHQVAVLHYEGATDKDPKGDVSYEAAKRQGLQVNSINTGMNAEGSLIIPELSAAGEDDVRLKPEADVTFYVSYDFYPLDNPLFQKPSLYGYHQVLHDNERVATPQLNHISMKLPPAPPLSQLGDLESSSFCNSSSVSKNCLDQYCECLHLLRVPLGAVVELFLIDEGVAFDANHPFHLHGTDFRVIAMDRLDTSTSVAAVRALDQLGGVHRKLHKAPVKDVVTIPDGGYTAVRFQASNPGFWMLHCHIDFHSDIGMALVFQFGEPTDFPPIPQGFPRCGNSSSFGDEKGV